MVERTRTAMDIGRFPAMDDIRKNIPEPDTVGLPGILFAGIGLAEYGKTASMPQ